MNAAFEEIHFQLSALGDFFLLFEQQNTRMHVAIAAILEAQPRHDGNRRASVGT